jgi:hypothetical protein
MRRISRRHGEKLTSLQQAVMWVRDTVHDLWQLIHPMQHRVLSQEVPKWRRPVDTVHDHSGPSRDLQSSTGLLVWQKHRCLQDGSYGLPGWAEASEAKWWATDCLELINLWKKKEVQRSIVDLVLKEIDDIRLVFSFSYVNRSCNKVAHALAKQVSNMHHTEMWHVTPVCVWAGLVWGFGRLMFNETQASKKTKSCPKW